MKKNLKITLAAIVATTSIIALGTTKVSATSNASNSSKASNASNTSNTKKAEKVEYTAEEIAKLMGDKNMYVDKEHKTVIVAAEVNGTYFNSPTRHGVVFKSGSNGEKAVLRGLSDEKEFYFALAEFGFKEGNNLTAADMKAKPGEGKKIEGEKLDLTVLWDGQKEMPFQNIIKTDKTDEYKQDFRFGGNIERAKKNNTGCLICLDSCATGIVSDASIPSNTVEGGVNKFFGNEEVLPEDGTKVYVVIRQAN